MVNSLCVRIDTFFHYPFEVIPPKFSDNFPIKIDLEDIDIFTMETFKEQYIKAQSNRLPYYLISIIELTSTSSKPFYKIYSTIAFRGYQYSCKEKQIPLTCPETRLPIIKIHVFAIECFKTVYLNKTIKFIPKSINNFSFFKYFCSGLSPKDSNVELLVDALNFYIDDNYPSQLEDRKYKQKCITNIFKIYYFKLKDFEIISQINDVILALAIESQKWQYAFQEPQESVK